MGTGNFAGWAWVTGCGMGSGAGCHRRRRGRRRILRSLHEPRQRPGALGAVCPARPGFHFLFDASTFEGLWFGVIGMEVAHDAVAVEGHAATGASHEPH